MSVNGWALRAVHVAPLLHLGRPCAGRAAIAVGPAPHRKGNWRAVLAAKDRERAVADSAEHSPPCRWTSAEGRFAFGIVVDARNGHSGAGVLCCR